MPTYLTRRVTFAAAHRYRIASWSDDQNDATFGHCARPSYHGHSYVCDVTVAGHVNATTGFLVDLPLLDRALQHEVHDQFDHRNINVDIPAFGDGGLVPTGENLARFICERVQEAIGPAARVVRVVIAEDATLSATYEPE